MRNRSRIAVACGAAIVAAAQLVSAGEPAPAQQASRVRVEIFAPQNGPGRTCARVYPLQRNVAGPAVLAGAMRALLTGPTPAEQRRGYGGWFSAKTASALRGARLLHGVAYIDFRDFSHVIPNASSSCGSTMLLAQLNRTATQFPQVRRAVFSFNGSSQAFYEWLQFASPERGVNSHEDGS